MFLSYRRILDAKWTPFIGKMWAFVLKRSRRIIGQGRSERSGLTQSWNLHLRRRSKKPIKR